MTFGLPSLIILGLLATIGVLVWRLVRLRRLLAAERAARRAAEARVGSAPDPRGDLMARLGWARDALPDRLGWSADDGLLLALAGLVAERRPGVVVELGSGLSTAVLARALDQAGGGHLWSVEHDAAWADQTAQLLAGLGLADRVTLIRAPLTAYGDQKWYSRAALAGLPGAIDLVVIDGPPGNVGRHPAGPELLVRLAPGGRAVLDDGERLRERRILEAWAREHPRLVQTPLGTRRGAVLLADPG